VVHFIFVGSGLSRLGKLSLELIAEEIKDPFGNDDNDVPTGKVALNIQK
jgi:predicted membrane chloride channel (bestrophin family)